MHFARYLYLRHQFLLSKKKRRKNCVCGVTPIYPPPVTCIEGKNNTYLTEVHETRKANPCAKHIFSAGRSLEMLFIQTASHKFKCRNALSASHPHEPLTKNMYDVARLTRRWKTSNRGQNTVERQPKQNFHTPQQQGHGRLPTGHAAFMVCQCAVKKLLEPFGMIVPKKSETYLRKLALRLGTRRRVVEMVLTNTSYYDETHGMRKTICRIQRALTFHSVLENKASLIVLKKILTTKFRRTFEAYPTNTRRRSTPTGRGRRPLHPPRPYHGFRPYQPY